MAQKKQPRRQYPVIQFRPGGLLNEKIARVAKAWGLSANDAARHICLLALSGLRPMHHDLIQELAVAQGDPEDFASAAQSFAILSLHARPSAEDPDLALRGGDPESKQISEMIERLKAAAPK